MDIKEVFDILKIEITKDENKIGEAYRTELRKHNPEDDPDGFKKVRTAYENAISFAREKDQGEGFFERGENDPLNVFYTRLDELYKCYKRRINPEEWKNLLSDPVVTALDTAEEVRRILFSYLQSHFYLSNSVYKVIDDRFFIGENFVELSGICEEGFLRYAMAKAANRYFDFEYETVIGTPEKDEDGVIDRYIGSLIDLVSPYSEVEDIDAELGKLLETGLLHPWFVLMAKRNDLIKGELSEEQEKELFYCYMEEVPEENHQIIYRFFEYRVYETRAIICRKMGDIRDAFYYYRWMHFIDDNEEAAAYIEESGKQTAELMADMDEFSEFDWNVFIIACKFGNAHELGIKRYERDKDKISGLDNYVYILQNIAEFYQRDKRHRDAIKLLGLIPDGADDINKYNKLASSSFYLTDRDGYNSRSEADMLADYVSKLMELDTEEEEEGEGEYSSDFVENLVNVVCSETRRRNAKRAIPLGEKVIEIITEEQLDTGDYIFEVHKLRAYFNLIYAYLSECLEEGNKEENGIIIEKTVSILKEAERYAYETQRIYHQAAFWSIISKCFYLSGRYKEAIEYLEQKREFLEINKDKNEELYEELNPELCERLISFYTAVNNNDKARENLEITAKGVFIPDPLSENFELDYSAITEKTKLILSYCAYEPSIFFNDESQRLLFDACDKLNMVLEKNNGYKGFSEFFWRILSYGPAIVSDHKRLYDLLVKDEFLDIIESDDKKRRSIFISLARLCMYAGNRDRAKIFAKRALDEATNECLYCIEKGMTVENAVEDKDRFANRMELSYISEAYIYMGDIDKARHYLSKMDGEEMCPYCIKGGCTEKYLTLAQIYAYEGEYEKALEYCDKTDDVEWHKHEEVALAIRRYISNMKSA